MAHGALVGALAGGVFVTAGLLEPRGGLFSWRETFIRTGALLPPLGALYGLLWPGRSALVVRFGGR